MYKVLIVEDEIWISALIRSVLEEGVPSVCIAGEAQNGQEALELIRTLRPDIVLTDINLPIMSGLEVITQAKAEGFSGKFAIISGYSDFSYAQQALRADVSDYLLKPVDDEELCRTVLQMTHDLDRTAKAAMQSAQNLQLLKSQFLSRVLMRDFLPMSACNDSYALHFSPGLFCCAALRFHAGVGGTHKIVDQERWIRELLISSVSGLCTEVFYSAKGAYLVLILGYVPENGKQIQETLERCLREILSRQTAAVPDIIIAVSQVQEDFTDMQDACRRTLRAVFREQSRRNQILYTSCEDLVQEETVSASDAAALTEAFQKPADQAAVLEWFNLHLTDMINRHQILNEDACLLLPYTAALLKVYFETASALFPRLTLQREHFIGQLKNCQTIQDLNLYLAQIVETVQSELLTQQDADDHIISRVKAYITANLASAVSLEAAADLVHLTPGYLSEYFKAKMGMNFKDYVLSLRMERAKYLLSRNVRVQDVAEQCGYNDVKYFQKIFKKYYKATPSEFRHIYIS